MLSPLLHRAQNIGVVQAGKRRENGRILLKVLHRRAHFEEKLQLGPGKKCFTLLDELMSTP